MTFLRKLYRRVVGYRCHCGLRCKSQRGLTRHRRTMHEAPVWTPILPAEKKADG